MCAVCRFQSIGSIVTKNLLFKRTVTLNARLERGLICVIFRRRRFVLYQINCFPCNVNVVVTVNALIYSALFTWSYHSSAHVMYWTWNLKAYTALLNNIHVQNNCWSCCNDLSVAIPNRFCVCSIFSLSQPNLIILRCRYIAQQYAGSRPQQAHSSYSRWPGSYASWKSWN